MFLYPLALQSLGPSWALPLFFFSSSVHLCKSDACWHIFGQGRASSISGRCPHACEVITSNRSKTFGTLFMHCWKLRYSIEVGQKSIATPYSEVMTSSWLSAPSQIQRLGLCVLLLCSVEKATVWDTRPWEKNINKQHCVFTFQFLQNNIIKFQNRAKLSPYSFYQIV